MDPEPKALRPVMLMTTVTVVLSCAAAFLVLSTMMTSMTSEESAAPGEVRAIPDPPGTTDGQRVALADFVATAITEGAFAADGAPADGTAEDRLSDRGLPAAARVLSALHALSTGPAAAEAATRARVAAADRVLRRIRAALPSSGPAVPPLPAAPEPWIPWARFWFGWWDAVQPPGTPPR